MATPPARSGVSGTPTRATANTAFGALYDYVTGLLGATGNAPEARTALGASATGSAVFTAATAAIARAAIAAREDSSATARLLGRATAGTGALEELTGAAAQGLTPINQARIDLASAPTVNLTTGAASTDHINITGTTTINGFTVAAGRLMFVRFNAALTLTNSAGLVTQSGANLTTAAGDTCLLRATSANTVEVLAYARAAVQAIGDGQTWQVLTGSRAVTTTYTNTTGRPIMVSALITINGANLVATGLVGGVVVAWGSGVAATGYRSAVCFVVPAGSTYSVSADGGTPTLSTWTELR